MASPLQTALGTTQKRKPLSGLRQWGQQFKQDLDLKNRLRNNFITDAPARYPEGVTSFRDRFRYDYTPRPMPQAQAQAQAPAPQAAQPSAPPFRPVFGDVQMQSQMPVPGLPYGPQPLTGQGRSSFAPQPSRFLSALQGPSPLQGPEDDGISMTDFAIADQRQYRQGVMQDVARQQQEQQQAQRDQLQRIFGASRSPGEQGERELFRESRRESIRPQFYNFDVPEPGSSFGFRQSEAGLTPGYGRSQQPVDARFALNGQPAMPGDANGPTVGPFLRGAQAQVNANGRGGYVSAGPVADPEGYAGFVGRNPQGFRREPMLLPNGDLAPAEGTFVDHRPNGVTRIIGSQRMSKDGELLPRTTDQRTAYEDSIADGAERRRQRLQSMLQASGRSMDGIEGIGEGGRITTGQLMQALNAPGGREGRQYAEQQRRVQDAQDRSLDLFERRRQIEQQYPLPQRQNPADDPFMQAITGAPELLNDPQYRAEFDKRILGQNAVPPQETARRNLVQNAIDEEVESQFDSEAKSVAEVSERNRATAESILARLTSGEITWQDALRIAAESDRKSVAGAESTEMLLHRLRHDQQTRPSRIRNAINNSSRAF